MAYLTLDEATATLRALGDGAGLVSARWLVLRLGETAEVTLATPRLLCGGGQCAVTSTRARWEQGCVCEQTALALRLWDRAFPETPPGVTGDGRKRRYRRKCPACRVPFVTAEKARQYCEPCLTKVQDA